MRLTPTTPRSLSLAILCLLAGVPRASAADDPAPESGIGVERSGQEGASPGNGEETKPPSAQRGKDEVELEEVVVGTGKKETPPPAVVEKQDARDLAKVNAVTTGDVLKYVPNVNVRKIQAGNTTQPLALRGNTSVTAAPRTLVYADGLQVTNYLYGGMADAPKWHMLAPQEIESVEILYGPFSAAYGGNSFGGTVLFTTRMPEKLELRANAGYLFQRFHAYGTSVDLHGYNVHASAGDRLGRLSFMIWYDRLQSSDQPITFQNVPQSAGGSSAGNPVSGWVADTDPAGKTRYILGSQGRERMANNTVKLKLGYDLSRYSQLRFTLGFWDSSISYLDPETYLRGEAGTPVYTSDDSSTQAVETADIDGRSYKIAADAFTYQRTARQDLMYGLTYNLAVPDGLKVTAGLQYYDALKDLTLQSGTAPPAAKDGRAGTITDKDNGSLVADAKAWHPVQVLGTHTIGGGYHLDRFELVSNAWKASDWGDETRTTLAQRQAGTTRTHAVFLEDTWQVFKWWSVYAGGRYEWWSAYHGTMATDGASGRISTPLPDKRRSNFSPKASTTFSYDDWSLRFSFGVANRYPTVGELYYGGISSTGTITKGNPELTHERNVAKDLTLTRALPGGSQVRLTLFQDDVTDAIFSQTNTVTNVTNFQNVGKVRTRGVEVSVVVRRLFLQGLGLTASTGYNHAKILENLNVPASEGKRFPRVPAWRAKAALDYSPTERWLLSFAGNYASRAFNNLDNSDTRGGYGSVTSYLVFDAKVSYQLARWLKAAVGVDNLTDYLYFESHPYPRRTFHGDLSFEL